MKPLLKQLEIHLSPADLAAAFVEMDDEQQAQFFIDVAALARTWGQNTHWQWSAIGGHLRKCKCSTPEARAMVEEIYEAMQPLPTPGTTKEGV